MRVPAVRNAVALIAESVAQIRWCLHRQSDQGAEEDLTHPLALIFRDGPNSWTTWPEFVSSVVVDAIKFGRGFAYVSRAVDGRILEIIHLPQGQISRNQPTPVVEPVYLIPAVSGGTRQVLRNEIIELSALGGRSLITEGREAIGLAAALEKHAAKILGKGARPSGVLERSAPTPAPGIPSKSPEQAREAESRFNAAWGGPDAAGGTIMLPLGSTFKPLTFSSVDLQFSEMRAFQVDEIARVFRVPPTLLQQLGRATFNNSEILGAQFVRYCLLFWITSLEAALRISCLTPEERNIYSIEGDVSTFERADTLARFQAYAAGITNSFITPNEARADENLPPKQGGDELVRPLNLAPAASAATPTTGAGK